MMKLNIVDCWRLLRLLPTVPQTKLLVIVTGLFKHNAVPLCPRLMVIYLVQTDLLLLQIQLSQEVTDLNQVTATNQSEGD